ncbi:MAG: phosphatidylglycerol lysyltransferase domain-containing protein [Sulfurimonas sp.]|nr:phosphatidylglycerol lysyltransferase domain-containing protein [Sulfurimonas sp.]
MVDFRIGAYLLKPFNIDSKELMESYLQYVQSNLSDYSFAANFMWLGNSSGFYTIVNDTFCLFILSGSELSMLLPPLGKLENINDAIIECFVIMNTNNSSKYLSRIDYVDEYYMQNFIHDVEDLEIFEVLENYLVEKKLADYVYNIDDLIELRGNSYHTKRTEINKFKNIYPNYAVEILDAKIHAGEITELFNRWVVNRMKYMPKVEIDAFLDGINYERFAIKRILKYYDRLNLYGMVLKIDGAFVGFTVGEKVSESTASVLIEKTEFDILGSAQFIFREFCKVLKEQYGSTYINAGDDMGFENLKKVKLSYRPKKLLPKYSIYQKN